MWSKLIPIPKKPSPEINDFRPISILNFLSKALEKLMYEQLISTSYFLEISQALDLATARHLHF